MRKIWRRTKNEGGKRWARRALRRPLLKGDQKKKKKEKEKKKKKKKICCCADDERDVVPTPGKSLSGTWAEGVGLPGHKEGGAD